ncbi:hypothetical protein WMY93_025187 [Mugilogobius chulae]|uniref:RING-type E3 ubiquitin transferase n=1 Tax=Mugilogobius chulae TaxID=88201 RepID=A0AAW0NBP6_9GOBI
MAEAPPWPSRFFCHSCSAEISPRLPDYTCPRCDSGFIEELLEERSADNGSMSTISSGLQNQQHLRIQSNTYLRFLLVTDSLPWVSLATVLT